MLQTLREHSGSWFVKVLLGVLVASFALWGVGDVFRSYTSNRPVAIVGEYSITQEEFADAFKRMTVNLQQMSKGKLTQDQIKAMGLPKHVLDDLISQALIWEEVSHLKLGVTDLAIRNHVQSIPAFLNEQGQFDRRAFDYLLQHNGITENKFLNDVRSSLLKQQLLGALTSGMHLPKSYIMTLFKALEEKRVFVSVTIPLTKMVIAEKPSEAILEQYHQQNKEQFTRPEYRKVTLLVMDPKEMRIITSPTVVRDEYERRRAEFEIPEKREVKQIIFSTKEAAQKGLESLRKGRPMASVARDLGAEFKDLGVIAKQGLPDNAAESVFKLELGKVSDIIETPFGVQIYTVTKIKPSESPTYESLEQKIADELRVQQANDQLFEIKNEIEDALAGGGSLTDIAKEHQFQLKTFDAIDVKGMDPQGKSALPDALKIQALESIFSLSEGGDSPVVDVKDGLSFVVHVDKVTASYVPEFKDITDQVGKAWLESKQHEAAAQLAQSLSKEASSVSGLTKLASKNKLVIETLEPMSRLDVEKNPKVQKRFTPTLLHQVFGLTQERSAFGPIKEGFAVVMLQKTLPLDQKETEKKLVKFNQSVQELAQKDVATLYIQSLKQKYKVSVNQSIADGVIGG